MVLRFTLKTLAIIALLLDEEEEENKRIRKRRFSVHPILRKRKIEGEYWTLFKQLMDHDTKFFEYFRMPIHDFNVLLGKIEKSIKKKNTTFKEAISPRERLAVCLRFLATGDSYKTIAFSHRLGATTVSQIVIEVCNAIIKQLMAEYIGVPSREKWLTIAKEFWNVWNFPNCIGALGGKHVAITAPRKSGSLYFNNKKTFSIVLLALVDANYKFIAVDIGSYGKNSDGGIFSHSNLGKSLEMKKLNVPEDRELPGTEIMMPHAIVGDEAFPLKSYLLRPYPKPQLDDPAKRHYNYRHSRARSVSENAFGILTHKFRIYFRRLNLSPENADKVILATCILHNFIISSNKVQPVDVAPSHTLHNLDLQGGNSTFSAFNKRDELKDFLYSDLGRIEWLNTEN